MAFLGLKEVEVGGVVSSFGVCVHLWLGHSVKEQDTPWVNEINRCVAERKSPGKAGREKDLQGN